MFYLGDVLPKGRRACDSATTSVKYGGWRQWIKLDRAKFDRCRSLLKKMLLSLLGFSFLLTVAACGMPKSDNPLYNQLVVIMKETDPTKNGSYHENVSAVICPLVSEPLLMEMISGWWLKNPTSFRETTKEGYVDPIGTKIWTISMWLGFQSLQTETLTIIFNPQSTSCSAHIRIIPV